MRLMFLILFVFPLFSHAKVLKCLYKKGAKVVKKIEAQDNCPKAPLGLVLEANPADITSEVAARPPKSAKVDPSVEKSADIDALGESQALKDLLKKYL